MRLTEFRDTTHSISYVLFELQRKTGCFFQFGLISYIIIVLAYQWIL